MAAEIGVSRRVAIGAEYRLAIPGWRPTLANELAKCGHWARAGRLKRRDAETVGRAMLVFEVPKATGRRSVRFVISGRYSRFPDPDAPLKSGLDALKRAGAIVDDSAEWCVWGPAEYRRGPKQTVIILREEPW